MSIRKRSLLGMSHIPEDRHKHGLVLDYPLEYNMILQRYFEPRFTDKAGFLRRKNIRAYAERLIEQYDVRSGQGAATIARSMSGGNQQKADRILVMYEGEIVGELDPRTTSENELGLYMAGAKRDEVRA